MMEVRVFARQEDGPETDITEGVQALYDLVIGSADWGSGFLTEEDAIPIVHVAKTAGFKGWEEAQRYVDAQRQSKEQQAFIAERNRVARQAGSREVLIAGFMRGQPHDHVWSSFGKCMWPDCQAVATETVR